MPGLQRGRDGRRDHRPRGYVGPGARRLPADWQPDFVVLYLPYSSVPAGLWLAPVPLVGLALDWHLLWHDYRQRLPMCDLVLTDPAGATR